MENIKNYDVKITVLKKTQVDSIHKEYAKSDIPIVCSKSEEGDEFISKNATQPEGFCNGAWKGIADTVSVLASGGNNPYVKQDGVAIRCCNDGLHPVIYKLERIID
ncbi:putative repeat protein (TIGR04076 family) [Clostridium tetanomorphum]|uniref:TIGR04076 family protein n=1 Tax=Clostridium tetanomorphum TaxID=1553 RepID=A0A923EAH2_CLOTT|nr:TIGR04076 family protein [Clostridium tetanomorphum]KAJ53879.1 TIGR04076 family protein [Clostridium tetanomorphum DSM 665]MBC2397394.1 TIGR04076 family protein [Clostridium tetanomorphum]MBP1862614.1 putative repeat protein (TIGR04076 family) [Clostridium tetanomorphum]NRS85545.1 putative repeat protein (TIGR04076 family) [Clostridium tetanomorphum]NRZ96444.1 putative repeat protein (TIGR04076 family) [Clostridium tetanomorphum]